VATPSVLTRYLAEVGSHFDRISSSNAYLNNVDSEEKIDGKI